MCLTVQDINGQLPTELVPMKAKKDIVVYKLLEYMTLEYVTVEGRLPYLYKKIYCTPYMGCVVKFNLFDRCVMKSDRMVGKYVITPSYQRICHRIGAIREQNIEWINGENVSNVMRSNDIGINDKETLYISEGIHAYTKILECAPDHHELHKAIIPKGSYYFVDEVNNEIVADKMIIFKKVEK